MKRVFPFVFLLSGCGTTIEASTACGTVHYDSVKDQTAPYFECIVNADGSSKESVGAGKSDMSAVVQSTFDGVTKLISTLGLSVK